MKLDLVYTPDETVTEVVQRRTFPPTVYATVEYAEPMSHFVTGLQEIDPTGRSAKEEGAKLDQGKIYAHILQDFDLALTEVMKVATFGANKYTRGGWESVPNGYVRYSDAMMRHYLKEGREDNDPDSGLSHQAHLAWNALARLQFLLRGDKNE